MGEERDPSKDLDYFTLNVSKECGKTRIWQIPVKAIRVSAKPYLGIDFYNRWVLIALIMSKINYSRGNVFCGRLSPTTTFCDETVECSTVASGNNSCRCSRKYCVPLFGRVRLKHEKQAINVTNCVSSDPAVLSPHPSGAIAWQASWYPGGGAGASTTCVPDGEKWRPHRLVYRYVEGISRLQQRQEWCWQISCTYFRSIVM